MLHNTPKIALKMPSLPALGWETETAHEISAEGLAYLGLQYAYKCTRSITIKELVVKLHTRWNYSPDWLHRIYPLVPAHASKDVETGILYFIRSGAAQF